MKDGLDRRRFMLGGLAAALFPVSQAAQAQSTRYTVDNFPYNPGGAQVGVGPWSFNMDIALLHPDNGVPTSGWYASLDQFHGTPFEEGWRNFYRNRIGRHLHDTDQGTLLLLGQHIIGHGATVRQIQNAYDVAKALWDANPHLRVSHLQTGRSFDYG